MIKTQGRRGEVAAELHTDFPERFEQRRKLCALDVHGNRRELQLEEFWPHKGQLVLKFAGVDSISEAESLVGCELQIPASERAELDGRTAYVSDLIGCVVWDGERQIGVVRNVDFGAGEAPLLMVKGSTDFEIPYAEAFLKSVDLRRKEIHMSLPEGMLEINTPLTKEEKQRQSGSKTGSE